jgi:hypothetical protein
MATRRDRADAAEALAALLSAVDGGELSADTPQEKRLLRRIEGAVAVLGAEVGPTEPS